MPGLSIHVVDVTRGVPAQGMRIDVYELGLQRRKIAHGQLGPTGALDHPLARERLKPGTYEVIVHAGAFFNAAGVAQAAPPFLGEVPFRFTIAESEQHYHLSLKITPWGFSLYRGR
jgi:5-hydroxyisourate hydrolase